VIALKDDGYTTPSMKRPWKTVKKWFERLQKMLALQIGVANFWP
jgi:hypothetical protein